MKKGCWALGSGLWSEGTRSLCSCSGQSPAPRAQRPRGTRARARSRGVTLVELVLSIVIVSVAVSAVLGVLSMLATGSAEAMIRNQAVAIANAYLEEITHKPYTDPDSVAEVGRAQFDDINDYNGLNDIGARDQLGNVIAGLEQYTVTVTVGAGTLPSIAAASVRRIDVRVQHPSGGVNMTLSGYRTEL